MSKVHKNEQNYNIEIIYSSNYTVSTDPSINNIPTVKKSIYNLLLTLSAFMLCLFVVIFMAFYSLIISILFLHINIYFAVLGILSLLIALSVGLHFIFIPFRNLPGFMLKLNSLTSLIDSIIMLLILTIASLYSYSQNFSDIDTHPSLLGALYRLISSNEELFFIISFCFIIFNFLIKFFAFVIKKSTDKNNV